MQPGAAPVTWPARLPLSAGILALLLLIGGLGVWSVQTKLASAVVSSGTVQVESRRQVVQHPEGGVVSQILVRDGDIVEPGDVLIVLDGTRLRSELSVVEGQLREISARQARLVAERDDADTITFDPGLLAAAASDAEVRKQIDGETALFQARRDAIEQQVGLLREQNAQIENRITGIASQMEAVEIQIDIVDQQLTAQQTLLDQKLIQVRQVLELQREQADLKGQLGRLEAETAELRGQAASNGISLLQLRTNRQEEAVTNQRDLQYTTIELIERQLSLRDTLSRLEVRAPIGGIVYESQVRARQSVVQPAQDIMFIVPQSEPLIVTARVNAIDIDEISVGQEASLLFPAFDQRQKTPVEGLVTKISADAIIDEATGVPYYAIEIGPKEGILSAKGDDILLPGMPVEAFIKTGDQTAFAYLIDPLQAFFRRAFRE
ncbi:HlyD family type I secretion periplasmic adaptor subunit [Roseovarius sp. M141]|nr:HlyD family type I secretion periplasmic adaptor subunit [Roseovarius sp. M141]